MQAHHVDEVLGGQGGQIALVVDDGVIHRHGADHDGALVGQLLAERLGVAVAGQVHDGLCAHVDGAHHLFHLDVVVLAVAGDAKVDVDLGAQHGADALGVQAGVVLVGRDGDLALGDQLPDLFNGAVLLLGHDLHFRGDDALAGGVHLGGVSLHGLFLHFDVYAVCDASGGGKVPEQTRRPRYARSNWIPAPPQKNAVFMKKLLT